MSTDRFVVCREYTGDAAATAHSSWVKSSRRQK